MANDSSGSREIPRRDTWGNKRSARGDDDEDDNDDRVDGGPRSSPQAAEAWRRSLAYDSKNKGCPKHSLCGNARGDEASITSQQRQDSTNTQARARANKHRLCGRRHRPSLPVLPTLLLAVPLAAMSKMLQVEAVFTPRNRAELQGDGTAGGGGVFGCVGACGQSLLVSSLGYTYCHYSANGPWESGDGSVCANANSDVPIGQDNGKYGAIESWNVTKVTNMAWSECSTTVHPCVVFFLMSPLSLFSMSDLPQTHTHTHLSSSSSSWSI